MVSSDDTSSEEWLKLLVHGDSTPGFRHGKTNSVRSRVKELMPFPSLYLSNDERYSVKAEMLKVRINRLALGVSSLGFWVAREGRDDLKVLFPSTDSTETT
jgi:hypothetical protein